MLGHVYYLNFATCSLQVILPDMHKVSVKIEGIERRKKTTGILHLIAGLFLIANAGHYYKLLNYENFLMVLPLYIVAVVAIGYGLFRKKIDPEANYNHWIRVIEFMAFVGLGIAMSKMLSAVALGGLFLWAVVVLLLMFTERKVFHDTELLIQDNGIHVPGYFSNHVLPWELLENFVLREDYITIFRRDKKYVQLELLQDLSTEEIETINSFSKQKIEEAAVLAPTEQL